MREPTAAEVELLRHGLRDLAVHDDRGAAEGEPAAGVAAVLATGRRVRRARRTAAICAATLIVTGGAVAGLRLTGGGQDAGSRVVPAASGTSASASPAPLPSRTLNFDDLQLGPSRPEVGTRYPFDLTTHCGIRYAEFGGRSWRTDQQVPVPDPTQDPTTGLITEDGMLAGYVTVLAPDTIRYEAPGVVPVVFHLMDHHAPLCQ